MVWELSLQMNRSILILCNCLEFWEFCLSLRCISSGNRVKVGVRKMLRRQLAFGDGSFRQVVSCFVPQYTCVSRNPDDGVLVSCQSNLVKFLVYGVDYVIVWMSQIDREKSIGKAFGTSKNDLVTELDWMYSNVCRMASASECDMNRSWRWGEGEYIENPT